jgi:hypothetical protein
LSWRKHIRTSVIGLSLLGSVSLTTAQPVCGTLRWDYPGHPDLGLFRIYVSSQSGLYRKGKAFVPGGYVAVIPGIPEVLTSVACAKLVLFTAGTKYAVATAVAMDNTRESEFSNEISFVAANQTPLPPPSPPPTPIPPWPTLPPWQPPPVKPAAPKPPTPPSTGGGGITTTCQWTGTCE